MDFPANQNPVTILIADGYRILIGWKIQFCNKLTLALRPQYHWTDQKIKVHFFICVLGYLLSSIVYKQAKTGAEFKGTLDTLLDVLNNVRLATMLEDSETRGRVKAIYKLEEMTKEEKSIVESLGIENIHNDRIKFNGVGVYT